MSTTMSLTFLGVGSAFTTTEYYQSNLLITAASGKKMLVDCGSDARLSLAEWNMKRVGSIQPHIDAVYISHLHSDHIGGLEWLAFQSYFTPNMPRPKLFMVDELEQRIWDQSLRAGLEYIEEKTMRLSDYFEPVQVTPDVPFRWENVLLTPFRTVHVKNTVRPMYSYGLIMQALGEKRGFIFTTDTVLDQNLIDILIEREPNIQCIFQDCETASIRTGVHAHYTELCTLPKKLRRKMWLYHYNPQPPQIPQNDGFLGFVHKGQVFE